MVRLAALNVSLARSWRSLFPPDWYPKARAMQREIILYVSYIPYHILVLLSPLCSKCLNTINLACKQYIIIVSTYRHVGPTNSGKTFNALQALKQVDTAGLYLGELQGESIPRILEIYLFYKYIFI